MCFGTPSVEPERIEASRDTSFTSQPAITVKKAHLLVQDSGSEIRLCAVCSSWIFFPKSNTPVKKNEKFDKIHGSMRRV
jgi:hypothetical protein